MAMRLRRFSKRRVTWQPERLRFLQANC